MPTIINADTATGGAIITGDTSGQLQLQSGGVTALTTNGANVTVAGTFTATGGVTGVNLATGVTGILPVANGGTGATTLAANNVLLGNGTSAVQAVAPGASGNVLTSNGTTWASAAAVSGVQQFTSSGSITAGQAVTLNTDGTVSTVTGTSTSQDVLATNAVGQSSVVGARLGNTFYDAEIDRTLLVLADTSTQVFANSYRVAANGSRTSGGGVYLGTLDDNGNVCSWTIVKTGTARYAFVYRYTSSSAYIRGLTINTSTGDVTSAWGPVSVSIVNGSSVVDATYDTTSNRLIVAAKNSSSVVELYAFNPATGSQTGSLQVSVPSAPGDTAVAIASNTAVPGQFLVLCAQANNSSQMVSFLGTINSAGTTFTAGTWFQSISGSGIGSSVISLTYVSSINRYISIHSNSTNSFYPTVNIISADGNSVTARSFSFPDSRQVYRLNSGCIDVTNSEIRVIGANNASGSSLQYARMAFTASTLANPTYTPSFPSSGAYNTGSAIYTPTAYSTFLTACARDSSTTAFTVVAFTIASFSTNADKFIGFSTQSVSTGAAVTVTTLGGVNTNQSALTTGTVYYLQFNGALSTTPSTYGIVARALSATSVQVTTGGAFKRLISQTVIAGSPSSITLTLPSGYSQFELTFQNVRGGNTASAFLTGATSSGSSTTFYGRGLTIFSSNSSPNSITQSSTGLALSGGQTHASGSPFGGSVLLQSSANSSLFSYQLMTSFYNSAESYYSATGYIDSTPTSLVFTGIGTLTNGGVIALYGIG
jgi:hypothetical protein